MLKWQSISVIALLTGLMAAPAMAADEAPANPADAAAQEAPVDIIITGRAGNTTQKKVEASYAISVISPEELQMKAPIGVAEALKNVPGFWIESSSGEASGNIRVRGIPTDGYSSLSLLEDGITTQHDAGLGWLNGDQSLRMDQTVQQIEVVRGGPSSIFYSNAPGAVINFITRRGGDHLEGLARYEVADYNSHRVDGWLGGPIGNSDWRFFVGGYYRLSDGQRHTGFRQDEGGQIRATISRDFDNGSFMVGVKRIDERIGNAMVTPFVNDKDGDPVGVPGFNAKRDIIAGPETRRFTFLTPDGTYDFDNDVGTTIKLTQLTGELKYDLGMDFTIQNNMRYRDSFTKRNSITPRTVAAAGDLLASNYGNVLQPGQSLGFGYTNHPSQPFDMTGQNGNGLALLNLARSFTVPESEFINDLRLTKTGDFLGRHDIAVGVYYAHVKEDYRTNSAAIFTDVKDNAALLDAFILDAAGNPVYQLTNGGISSYGVEFNNANGTSDTVAVYASDEWQVTDKLRIDGGLRWERISTEGEVEGKQTIDLQQSASAADNAVQVGNGVFTPFDRRYDHTAWTLGANYQFQPDLGTFLRYTSTFRLPSVSSFLGDPTATPVTQKMEFVEGGVKFARSNFSLFLTGFYSLYKSYEISDYRQDPDTGKFVLNTVYGDTRTWGTELEATWRPVSWFDIHANWTWQDPKFSDFKYTDNSGKPIDYSDNRLIRVPKNSFRITPGLNFLDDRVRIEADVAYYGQRYADVANQINLPSYTTVDLNARFDVTDRLSFNLFVNNLTNTIGLTEGNPRAGTIENEEVGDLVYIARSIFGRSVRGAVTFRF